MASILQMQKRADMPSKNKIRKYWGTTSLWQFKGFDSVCEFLESDYCFACGFYCERLERAHIVPLCEGGSNQPCNLHLLCYRCHKDSEHLGGSTDDGQSSYWNWFWSRTMIDVLYGSASAIAGLNISRINDKYYMAEWALANFQLVTKLRQKHGFQELSLTPLIPIEPETFNKNSLNEPAIYDAWI